MVIVSGVQRNLLSPAGIGNGPDNFDGLIAIKGRYLYGHDILDVGEAPPEIVMQESSSDCRLQVKTDYRNDRSDGLGMVQKLCNALIP